MAKTPKVPHAKNKKQAETDDGIFPDAWKRFESAVDAATRNISSRGKLRAAPSRKKKK